MHDDIPVDNNTSVGSSPHALIKTLTTLGILLIVVIIGMFVWVLSQGNSLFNLNNEPLADITYDYDNKSTSTVQDVPTPFGELYLTLTPKTTGATNGYVYDLETSTMRPVMSGGNTSDDLSIFHSFDKSGVRGTYLRSSGSIKNPFVLFFKGGTSAREEKVASLSQPPMGGAVVSPNGSQLLYTGRTEGVSSAPIPNAGETSIILAERKAGGAWSSKRLWGGSSPQWVTDGLFYYLKDDGIYLGLIKQGIEDKVRKTTGALGGNSRLSISNDGKYLAWGLPDTGKVIIFSNKYDDGLKTYVLKEVQTIPASAFWFSFSPDSTKIAMQAVDWGTLETEPNPRIETYSISTGEKVLENIYLDDYLQTAMFLTDWR